MFIESGLLTFAAIIAVMCKMPRNTLQKFLGYDYYIDMIASAIVVTAMYGTYSGMMTGAVATLALSIAMAVAKRIVGYQRYHRNEGWVVFIPAWRHRQG